MSCHPGLVPGSRPAPDPFRELASQPRRPSNVFPGQRNMNIASPTETGALHWTPEQVRGDNRGAETVSRQGPNPRRNSKPDSSGLVPGIHVGPPPRSLPARTAMPRDVDGRNKSGHDGWGDDGGTGAAGPPSPASGRGKIRRRRRANPPLSSGERAGVRGNRWALVRTAAPRFRRRARRGSGAHPLRCGPRPSAPPEPRPVRGSGLSARSGRGSCRRWCCGG